MKGQATLTTAEAAGLASVAPSTIKRWADLGLLPFARTAGGHRRFERHAVEQVLRGAADEDRGRAPARLGAPRHSSASAELSAFRTSETPPQPRARRGSQPRSSSSSPSATGDLLSQAWVRCLLGARRHEIDGRLLEAHLRLGSWCAVAAELAGALVELGAQWQRGDLTIADEHIASDALVRALARIGDSLPQRLDGPRCLLVSVEHDEHTLGLSLAELCLRELAWTPVWLGRRTPLAEVLRLVEHGDLTAVTITASRVIRDRRLLRSTAVAVGKACQRRGVQLLLGGAARWPEPPPYGHRLHTLADFRQQLLAAEPRRPARRR